MVPVQYERFKFSLQAERFVCWKDAALDRQFIEAQVVGERGPAARLHSVTRLADGRQVFTKVYLPRAKHTILRRLKKSRALLEGAGYLAFARKGIATPRLLAWGEARRRWLWTRGFVITEYKSCPTVAERFVQENDPSLLERTIVALVQAHGNGLVHGDPRLRNFLAQSEQVLMFDLCSWRRFNRKRQARDLVVFLGSCLTVTTPGVAEQLLRQYARETSDSNLPIRQILKDAQAYAAREKQP